MSKTFKYVAGVFVIALMIGAIESTPAKAGANQHDGLDEICLCFGKSRSNGFNATGLQRNGRCARSQTGPFCFVATELMPLFWKVQDMRRCNNDFYIGLDGTNNCNLQCPPGKMVLSCNGWVEPNDWYYTYSNVHPHPSGLGCVHEISIARKAMDVSPETVGDFFDATTWAICASPGPDQID